MFKLETAFRNPRGANFRRTPGVVMRVLGTSTVRTRRVASLTLKVILVTKENPTFKFETAFRNPRGANFRRTPGVAMRVIGTSNIRTCRVASLTLKAIHATKETPTFELEDPFRNPRDTTFRRTPGVAVRVASRLSRKRTWLSKTCAINAPPEYMGKKGNAAGGT